MDYPPLGTWYQCLSCGEHYYPLVGNYFERYGISLCEYCSARVSVEIESEKIQRYSPDWHRRWKVRAMEVCGAINTLEG